MVSTDNAVICPSLYYFSAKTPLAFAVNQKLLLLPNMLIKDVVAGNAWD